MFLTIGTTGTPERPATDLGFLLHKHPGKAQAFSTSYGTAHVLYAEADQITANTSDIPAIHNGHIKQTVCRWCYGKIPLDQLCAAAARFGFKGIDLVEPADFPTLKKYNLVGTTVKTHSIPKGLNRKENWDECLGKIRDGIETASAEGSPNVICFSGNRAGMHDDEGMKNCAEALKQKGVVPKK